MGIVSRTTSVTYFGAPQLLESQVYVGSNMLSQEAVTTKVIPVILSWHPWRDIWQTVVNRSVAEGPKDSREDGLDSDYSHRHDRDII